MFIAVNVCFHLLIVHEKTGGSKMGIAEMLDELKQKALHDPKLRAELLATKKASTAICGILQQMQGTRI